MQRDSERIYNQIHIHTFCKLILKIPDTLSLVVVGLAAKSCPTLATPWTTACQAPPSMGFSRQEYWSGLPLPSPGDLPDPGIEPRSPASQADSLPTELQGGPDMIITHSGVHF